MENRENHLPMAPGIEAAAGTPSLDSKGAARRRFTRLGAGATGVILTLHSQPGMAAKGLGAGANPMICVAPSGFVSVTTSASRSPRDACAYNRSHGYWKTHPEEWKSRAGIDSEAKFGTVLRATGNYAGLADVTLMGVIDPSKEVKQIDQNNVAMQTVAALLNARASSYAGVPTLLSEETVMEIWNEFVVQGYYTPGTGNAIWTGADIAAYFETTFR